MQRVDEGAVRLVGAAVQHDVADFRGAGFEGVDDLGEQRRVVLVAVVQDFQGGGDRGFLVVGYRAFAAQLDQGGDADGGPPDRFASSDVPAAA